MSYAVTEDQPRPPPVQLAVERRVALTAEIVTGMSVVTSPPDVRIESIPVACTTEDQPPEVEPRIAVRLFLVAWMERPSSPRRSIRRSPAWMLPPEVRHEVARDSVDVDRTA